MIPHLEPGRLPSTVDPDALQPPDKGKRVPQRPVKISAWKLAKLDSKEAIKAGAKARASSSILRPVGSKYNPNDPDRLSSNNVSGRSSPNSTYHKISQSKNSYPPSRASREDLETCGHSVSNVSSPLPGRDHFNPVYQSSANHSPWSGKGSEAGNEAIPVPPPPRRNTLGVGESTKPSSVYWDQEAGRFVSASTTRSVGGSSSQALGTELTYTGQSIFFGGPLVGHRGSNTNTVSYYQQGRAQRGGQLPVFVPSEQNQTPRLQ